MILSPKDVHLWFAYSEKITDVTLLEQYNSLLSEEEKAKKSRFHFKKHQHQYLITRALVRSVLSMYVLEIQPRDWRFSTNKYGKPFISNSPLPIHLEFNLTHSDGVIVLAISNDVIGVDVENIYRENTFMNIAADHFTADEYLYLKNKSIHDQRASFFQLWTLKESYIKARGLGLSLPLNQFAFRFSGDNEKSINLIAERNEHAESWQFWQLSLNDSYIVSVTAKSNASEQPLSLSTRDIIPFLSVDRVNYPIVRHS